MSKVQKAVIPAAGWGTRFLPATKSQPKETLPLIDKPMIQYIVEEAVAAGIRQIIMVTSMGKRTIEDHFDRSFELEYMLQKKGDKKRLAEVRRISELADVYYVRQKEQLGLGHAILTAKDLVGDEPFAVFLPDDIIDSKVPAIRQLLDVYERYGGSVVAVEKVSDADVSRYGIVKAEPVGNRTYKVSALVEKPKLEEAPSNLAVIGRYILAPEIFGLLETGQPGAIGEIQLTDAIDRLGRTQPIHGCEYQGTRYDGGTPLGLLKASVQVALKRPDMAQDFRKWLKNLNLDEAE